MWSAYGPRLATAASANLSGLLSRFDGVPVSARLALWRCYLAVHLLRAVFVGDVTLADYVCSLVTRVERLEALCTQSRAAKVKPERSTVADQLDRMLPVDLWLLASLSSSLKVVPRVRASLMGSRLCRRISPWSRR